MRKNTNKLKKIDERKKKQYIFASEFVTYNIHYVYYLTPRTKKI